MFEVVAFVYFIPLSVYNLYNTVAHYWKGLMMIVLNKPHSVDKRLDFYMIHYIATINAVVATCKLLAS